MPDLSREEARAIVDEITEGNGGLSLEDRLKADPKLLKKIENLRRKLGKTTQTYSCLSNASCAVPSLNCT